MLIYLKKIFELFAIFTIVLINSLIFADITIDEIWCYGFCYSIVNGLISYIDYNMVIGPVYPYFNALFLLLFGNNMLVFHVINAVICVFIYILMKKIHVKSYFIVFSIFLLFSSPNYNILVLLFLYLILFLDLNIKKNYLVGFLIGFLFLIKINDGIILLVPTLFLVNIDRVIKRFLSFEMVLLLFFLIMLLVGNYNQFLNYTFLGLFDFGNKNLFFSGGLVFYFLFIILLIILFYKKKIDKIVFFYLLFFSLHAFPIFDYYHIIIFILPVLGFCLDTLNLDLKVLFISFCIFVFFLFYNGITDIYKSGKVFVSDSNLFNYRMVYKRIVNYFDYVSDYINEKSEYDYYYFFSGNAYSFKIESNIPINKFDIINNGNMGYMGEYVYYDEIVNNCSINKCLFIVDSYDNNHNQLNKFLLNNIRDYYHYKEKIYDLEIYDNFGK